MIDPVSRPGRPGPESLLRSWPAGCRHLVGGTERLRAARANLPTLIAHGVTGIAGCQVPYYLAASRLPVGVAILLEFTSRTTGKITTTAPPIRSHTVSSRSNPAGVTCGRHGDMPGRSRTRTTIRRVNWQATGAGPGGAPPGDPFTQTETDIRAMVASPWWQSAPPPQRADAITRRMLSGAGEWWLFGAWGRWYRCGLDGNWHPCPPPTDPRARQVAGPTQPGYGNPPLPQQFLPVGPDLAAGPVASSGFLGTTPQTTVVARLQQALINALSVDPAQYALQDPTFAPGTPSTLAAAWGSLLWCASAPVVLAEHPLIELFVPYLTVPAQQLRWLIPPDLSQLAAYYTTRLGAGDGVGATHVLRVMHEVAAGLREDDRFRPAADALATVTESSGRLVSHDLATARYGHAAIVQEWRRRCPADVAMPLLRDVSPGEYLRLAIYDLAQIVAAIRGQGGGHVEIRHAGLALLAADLHAVPHVVAALLPWLDPDGARTLQAVATEPAHPLRELWPHEGRLPQALQSTDTAALQALLATAYSLLLTSCRLAGSALPPGGFTVAGAAAAELTSPALKQPKNTGELTPWQIIDAARAHLAAERAAREGGTHTARPPEPQPAQPPLAEPPAAQPDDPPPLPPYGAGPTTPPPAPWHDPYAHPPYTPPREPAPTTADPTGGRPPAPPAPPEPPDLPFAPMAPDLPATPAPPLPQLPDLPPPAPAETMAEPATGPHAPAAAPGSGQIAAAPVAEAYGIRFLCGPDDAERLVTEVRRRGKWAQRLRGQEVTSASAPALLLIGARSTGQRRLARMIARALADVDVTSGQVHDLQAADLRGRDPEAVRAAIEEHAGHTLLLEGLDELILDDDSGPARASTLYRARVEGVSDTVLVTTCETERFGALSAAAPELVTDFRAVRLPDLSDPGLRAALLGLLAEERHARLSPSAWEVVHADVGRLRGWGRLVNARLIETYFDRACTRNLNRAAETQAIGSTSLLLTPADFEGLADELQAPSAP